MCLRGLVPCSLLLWLDTIPPSDPLSALKDAAIKDTPTQPITINGEQSQLVDGAHTQTNGIISTNEVNTPIIIIADAQPADVIPNSTDNIPTNNNTNNEPTPNQPSSSDANTKEVAEPAVIESEEKKSSGLGEKADDGKVVDAPIEVDAIGIEVGDSANPASTERSGNVTKEADTPSIVVSSDTTNTTISHPTPTNITTESGSSSSNNVAASASESGGPSLSPSAGPPLSHSRSGSNNSSNNNSSSNLGVNNSELRSSTRNLRSSVLGIEEEELDEV